MTGVAALKVPLPAEIGIGTHWNKAHRSVASSTRDNERKKNQAHDTPAS